MVKSTLDENNILINWFNYSQMQANPNTFQAISVGAKSHNEIKSFNIIGNNTMCEEQVKLLGAELDYLLNFDARKVAKQSNVLQRLGKLLTIPTGLIIF